MSQKQHMRESPVTPDSMVMAQDFTVFTGPAVDTGIGEAWDMFGIDGGRVPNEEVLREAHRNGIVVAFHPDGMWMTPEWDSDEIDPESPAADDLCACCAYLNAGGRLVKLPDKLGSKYFRLYPVVHVQRLPQVAEDGDIAA